MIGITFVLTYIMTHVQLMSPHVTLMVENDSTVEPHERSGRGTFFWWRIQPRPPPPRSLRLFTVLAVTSRKPAARSSKSIATQCGQMTTRLVWQPTSFHNMWPGLPNWRRSLGEKIFPCTKSDLAAGGLWCCEWAASAPAKDCRARRKHSIFLHPDGSSAPPTGLVYQRYPAGRDVSSISTVTSMNNQHCVERE